MHRYKERDEEEDRTPGGMTGVKERVELKEEDALDRTKVEEL